MRIHTRKKPCCVSGNIAPEDTPHWGLMPVLNCYIPQSDRSIDHMTVTHWRKTILSLWQPSTWGHYMLGFDVCVELLHSTNWSVHLSHESSQRRETILCLLSHSTYTHCTLGFPSVSMNCYIQQSDQYIYHMRVHTGENPCSVSRISGVYVLMSHMRIQTREKLYIGLCSSVCDWPASVIWECTQETIHVLFVIWESSRVQVCVELVTCTFHKLVSSLITWEYIQEASHLLFVVWECTQDTIHVLVGDFPNIQSSYLCWTLTFHKLVSLFITWEYIQERNHLLSVVHGRSSRLTGGRKVLYRRSHSAATEGRGSRLRTLHKNWTIWAKSGLMSKSWAMVFAAWKSGSLTGIL